MESQNATVNSMEQKQTPKWKSRLRTLSLPLIFIITKLKFALLFLGKIKFAVTAISMVISIVAYSLLFGWWFAVGFVLLIFVHEMGHAIQLKREGVGAGLPIFIPFLGAAIAMKEMPKNALVEARVGLAGPILGTLGCLVPLAAWLQIDGGEFGIWQALTYTGFIINLFNLLPVLPLDGGRAMAAVDNRLWWLGLVALGVFLVLTWSPILILIAVFALLESVRRFKSRNHPDQQAYYAVTRKQRILVLLVYLLLILILALGIVATYSQHGL